MLPFLPNKRFYKNKMPGPDSFALTLGFPGFVCMFKPGTWAPSPLRAGCWIRSAIFLQKNVDFAKTVPGQEPCASKVSRALCGLRAFTCGCVCAKTRHMGTGPFKGWALESQCLIFAKKSILQKPCQAQNLVRVKLRFSSVPAFVFVVHFPP